MFEKDISATSGISEEEDLLSANSSGTNDEENEYEDENEYEENEDDEDEQENNKGWKNPDKNFKDRLYKTVNLQSKTIKDLQNKIKDLSQNTNQWSVDTKLDKLYEKYEKEDVDLIKNLIREESWKVIKERTSDSVEKKELARFLKSNPDISEPMLKECQWRQKQFGYSLFEAKRVITWWSAKSQSNENSNSHQISWGWSNMKQSQQSKEKDSDKEAFETFQKKYSIWR